MRLVLLGPPGAGKGTQARALAALWGIPQVASGDLLRAVVREDSELGREAASYMDRGQLVPDELVLKLVAARLRKEDARPGFILDGFPRNVSQAEALAAGLDRLNLKLDKVVAVIVPDEEIVKRISGRRTCRNCDAMYHVVFEPPKRAGVCDKCGGELYQREDDAEETVRERLKVYAETTRPLLDHYGRLGLLAQVDGVGRTDEVEKRILSAVNGVAGQSAQS
ncbi:MAG TPA: adenylate kinase [Candidatus Binatus sp.]|uniref:adenylate kinase n=1 Tax=Candidatus Binatus sp. TaxID=2811406 RepID=UPI002B4AA777|nr:adenylate kinase [Candidatus Binatus sp.]HKN14782.1 adenylate kinase [Candidatus Binatus sp.]